ncbi:MarR family transcriptional regulator [Streptomyces sp. NPDC093085]|uniref:MarR family winged helix-turn-helix transcriptional regulator n=1 Tax=Streptomyces sp. NPDC093085 TaxID=3155068 RepID=UPI0034285C73
MSDSPAAQPPADPAHDEPSNTMDALAQLSFLVQGVLTRAAGRHDLSVIQLRLLGILRDRRPGMLELARHLNLDKSSITGLVSRAEKRGLVQRQASAHDGRAVLVSLTPPGRDLVELCAGEVEAEIAALTAELGPEEHRQILDLAVKLLRAGRSSSSAGTVAQRPCPS